MRFPGLWSLWDLQQIGLRERSYVNFSKIVYLIENGTLNLPEGQEDGLKLPKHGSSSS